MLKPFANQYCTDTDFYVIISVLGSQERTSGCHTTCVPLKEMKINCMESGMECREMREQFRSDHKKGETNNLKIQEHMNPLH